MYWYYFYKALYNKDLIKVNSCLNTIGFSDCRDSLGITAKQWQEIVLPEVYEEKGHINSLKPVEVVKNQFQILQMNANLCKFIFNFKLISKQIVPNLILAKVMVFYIRGLLKIKWAAFCFIDQTGRYANQLPVNAEKIAIRQVSDVMGHGVFSLTEINSDEAITEYIGIVSFRHRTSFVRNTSYIMSYPLPGIGGWVWSINALAEGNISRFINHSRIPNACVKIFYDGVLLRLAIVSLRPIIKGEAITLNYGPDYWHSRNEAA